MSRKQKLLKQKVKISSPDEHESIEQKINEIESKVLNMSSKEIY